MPSHKCVRKSTVDRAVQIVRELENQKGCDKRTLIKMLHQAANKLYSVGKFKNASEMYAKITTVNSELYGSGHPRTLCSKTREIITYNKQVEINNKMRDYLYAKKAQLTKENIKKKEETEKRKKKEEKKEAKLAL